MTFLDGFLGAIDWTVWPRQLLLGVGSYFGTRPHLQGLPFGRGCDLPPKTFLLRVRRSSYYIETRPRRLCCASVHPPSMALVVVPYETTIISCFSHVGQSTQCVVGSCVGGGSMMTSMEWWRPDEFRSMPLWVYQKT